MFNYLYEIFSQHILVRYLFSGGTAALVLLMGLYLLHGVLGLWYLASSVIAFLCSVMISFLLQKFWTFRNTEKQINKQFSLYITIAIINVIANAFFMYTFVDKLKIWYLFSQVLAAGIVAIWSFFVYRHFIFKDKLYAENKN